MSSPDDRRYSNGRGALAETCLEPGKSKLIWVKECTLFAILRLVASESGMRCSENGAVLDKE